MVVKTLLTHSKATWLWCLLAGASLPLAFAPFNLFLLAYFAPLVLFNYWLGATPRQAAWLGYLFGLGMFGVGVSWVYVAIHVFGYAPVPLALVMTTAFVAFLALYPALQSYVAVTFQQRLGLSRTTSLLLIYPSVWVLVEWLRGWFLTGFPWLNLGYSQLNTPLAGIAPVLGVYGVSWATALTAGLVLIILLAVKHRTRLLVGGGLAMLFIGATGLSAMEWTEKYGDPIKVSLLQGNAPQMTKWDPDQIQARLDLYANLTRQHWDSDLIFWPENAMTTFYHTLADDYFAPLVAEAKQHGTDLVVGVPVLDLQTDQYYSSFVVPGDNPKMYHKRHLVPFGEFVPLESLLRGLISFFDLPMSSFSRGSDDQPPLKAAGQLLAPTVCYEDAFGEEVINFLPQATLLINGSNNAWYGDSFAPHQHLQISRMRALETGRPLLRATTNGISAIIDYKGYVVKRSPQFETYVLSGEVQPRSGATPYVRWGNWPVIVVGFLVLGVVWL
ncbi:MAG: apolipoprotein N-acyltransferase, partial [Gammaproteobacteria bacterium]